MSFKKFNLDESIMEGLESMGFETPTPIQDETIPVILEGKDLIACAQTGTGKTAAYLLPIIHRILKGERDNFINTLIIVPTRELALQIDQQLEGFGYFSPVSSISVYGGGDGPTWDQQKSALIDGAEMVIATPGRMIQHLTMGYVNLSKVKHLILDEADRMLDMGFYDDIMKIISYTDTSRQTLLYSATMPPKIRKMTSVILKDPVHINIAVSKPAENVVQAAYSLYESQKIAMVSELLADKIDHSALIFASTKKSVKEIEKALRKIGFEIRAMHSDLDQNEREEVMREFKGRRIKVLVATDIISRGIDIDGIDLVLNYDVPHDGEDYIHRIGRTARADQDGVALTFISPQEQQKFQRIEQLIGEPIYKVPVPSSLGEAPEYNPAANKEQGYGRGFKGGKKFGNKGGGKNKNRREAPASS